MYKWDLLRQLMIDRSGIDSIPSGEEFKKLFYAQPEGVISIDLTFWSFIDKLQTKKILNEL